MTFSLSRAFTDSVSAEEAAIGRMKPWYPTNDITSESGNNARSTVMVNVPSADVSVPLDGLFFMYTLAYGTVCRESRTYPLTVMFCP